MAYGATYGKYAYNMAASIKHYNKIIPIHLICDHLSIDSIDTSIFDSFEIIAFGNDAGLNKILLFDRSPFNKTLYLDVDGICLNDPDKVFNQIEKDHYIFSQLMGSGGINDDISYAAWAENEIVWKKFNLKQDAIFPTLQTSIVYFDKSKEAKEFFHRLKENYSNRLSEDEYKEMWGRSKQHPDELYYSITMAQLNLIPTKSIQPVFFPNKIESISTIERDYLILAMWGSGNLVRPYAKDLYDRIMFKIMGTIGRNHIYKAQSLYKGKMTGIK